MSAKTCDVALAMRRLHGLLTIMGPLEVQIGANILGARDS